MRYNDPRYVIHPGYVRSANDGQLHWITAGQLIKLYQLPPNSRVLVIQPEDPSPDSRSMPGDIHLWPRKDGDYTRP